MNRAGEGVDRVNRGRCNSYMRALEFVTDLSGESVLAIPKDIADQLPKEGRARVLVLVDDDSEDTRWRRSAYEQFMRDDAPEDSVSDSYL